MSDHKVLTDAMFRVDEVWQDVYTISPKAADELRGAFMVLDAERERLEDEAARETRAEKNRARRVARRRDRVVRTARILWPDFDTARGRFPRLAVSVLREAILIDQAFCPEAWK